MEVAEIFKIINNEEILSVFKGGLKTFKYFVKCYYWILTLRFTIQWFPNINPYVQPMYLILYLTDPFLENFESFVPNVLGVDMSALLGFICLEWLLRTLEIIKFY